MTVQLAETLPTAEGKVKTTWLLLEDLERKVKLYALDNDTNATAEVLEYFLSSKKESKAKQREAKVEQR